MLLCCFAYPIDEHNVIAVYSLPLFSVYLKMVCFLLMTDVAARGLNLEPPPKQLKFKDWIVSRLWHTHARTHAHIGKKHLNDKYKYMLFFASFK